MKAQKVQINLQVQPICWKYFAFFCFHFLLESYGDTDPECDQSGSRSSSSSFSALMSTLMLMGREEILFKYVTFNKTWLLMQKTSELGQRCNHEKFLINNVVCNLCPRDFSTILWQNKMPRRLFGKNYMKSRGFSSL